MSKPVIAVATVAALAVGGYSAVWFKKADEFKSKFIESVVAINANTQSLHTLLPEGQAKPATSGDLIRYESVEMSGFPFNMALTVHKPVITLPIDTFLRAVPATQDEAPTVPSDFTWMEELAYSNSMTLSSNLIGSKFTLSLDGNVTQKSTVNGQVQHTSVNEAASPMVCNLETTPSGFLVIHPVVNSMEEFFAMFHSAECNGGNSTSKDANGQVIASLGSLSFGVKNVANESNRQASLKMQFTDLTYGPGADAMMVNYLRTIATATGQAEQKMPYQMSETGKNNFNMDLFYDGPSSEAGFKNANLKINTGINAFDYSSALMNFTTQFRVNVEPQGDKRKASILIKTKGNVTERYDQVLAHQVKQTLEEMTRTAGKTSVEVDIANGLNKLGSIDTLVSDVLPRFHPMGDMIVDFETQSEGPNNDTTFFTQGQHVLKSLNLLTALYGIKSNGEVKAAEGGMPSGNFSLTCINCDSMIDDLGNYAIRISRYFDALEPEKSKAYPGKAFYDGIKAFAHAVALNGSDPAAKDLNFTVIAKGPNDITVSGKNVMEVMEAYMTHVAPNLPQQPAPQIPNENLPPLIRQPQE